MICIFYADDFNYLSITYVAFNESVVVDVKDIPEDIVRKFSEYIESEFFEIDLRKYIEMNGLMNVRLYGA